MVEKILLSISVLSAILYISYIWLKLGVLESISDSWYKLPAKQKWLFTAFIWSFGIPVMLAALNPLMFLAGALICFVGVNPEFKWKKEAFMHIFSATGAIVLAMTSLVLNYKAYWSVIIFLCISALLRVFKINNVTWWTEISAIIIILISLFIYI